MATRCKSNPSRPRAGDSILLIPELLSVKSGGDFGVLFIVESSIGGWRARLMQRNLINQHLKRRRKHTYWADSAQSGGVKCNQGKIRVDPGGMVRKPPHTALVDSSYFITVHAIRFSRYNYHRPFLLNQEIMAINSIAPGLAVPSNVCPSGLSVPCQPTKGKGKSGKVAIARLPTASLNACPYMH